MGYVSPASISAESCACRKATREAGTCDREVKGRMVAFEPSFSVTCSGVNECAALSSLWRMGGEVGSSSMAGMVAAVFCVCLYFRCFECMSRRKLDADEARL